MTILVTRNLPERFGGFLRSCMLEVTPGTYIAPRMNRSVRDRVWQVMQEWGELIPADGGVALFWPSRESPGGLGIYTLGWPRKEIIDFDGVWVSLRELNAAHHLEELCTLANTIEVPDDGLDPVLEVQTESEPGLS